MVDASYAFLSTSRYELSMHFAAFNTGMITSLAHVVVVNALLNTEFYKNAFDFVYSWLLMFLSIQSILPLYNIHCTETNKRHRSCL